MFKHNIFLNQCMIAGLLLLSLNACYKETVSPYDMIAGEWTVSEVNYDIAINGKTLKDFYIELGMSQEEARQLEQTTINEWIQSNKGTITFHSDKTYAMNLTGSSDSGPWVLSSDNKKMTLTNQLGGQFIYDIITLTKNVFQISHRRSQIVDFDNNGTYETFAFTVTMTLVK